MKSLFEADRLTLDGAVALTAASLRSYGATHKHWRIAFSGGKDSTATATVVSYLIASGQVPTPESIGVLYADTRLELPNLQASAMNMLAVMHGMGWSTTIVLPALDKRFFVMMFGRGIPPSHSGFRWCTGAIKVDPMSDGMVAIKEATNEKLLLITGMRIGESANRDNRIALACSNKNGGECGQGWYEQTTPAEVADVLSPILNWRTCHVWDWLMLRRKQHGFDCSEVAEVYDQDADGSSQEVLARTGCLSCPVASRDLVLERTVKKPEWAYLSPLLRLRPQELSLPKNRLQKNGERTKNGELSSRPMRIGPLIMSARRMGIVRVLAIQDDVNAAAERLGQPKVVLINDEELARIEELIAANTWPDKWDGTEPVGDTVLPEIRRDGTTLPVLF